MGGALFVYTDASVPDQPKREPGKPPPRQTANHAFVAWCGWHDLYAHPIREDKPTFGGEAYVGTAGSQRAEFLAAIFGLSAAFAYIPPLAAGRKPDEVILRVDSSTVERLLNERGGADVLHPYLVTAQTLIALEQSITAVSVERVRDRDDRLMTAVDGRTRQAVRVVKREKGWPAPPDAMPF